MQDDLRSDIYTDNGEFHSDEMVEEDEVFSLSEQERVIIDLVFDFRYLTYKLYRKNLSKTFVQRGMTT